MCIEFGLLRCIICDMRIRGLFNGPSKVCTWDSGDYIVYSWNEICLAALVHKSQMLRKGGHHIDADATPTAGAAVAAKLGDSVNNGGRSGSLAYVAGKTTCRWHKSELA